MLEVRKMNALRLFRVVMLGPIGILTIAVLAGAQSSGPQHNQLTHAERTAGWRLLFDGKSLAGWRGLGHAQAPTAHWKVGGGAIHKLATAEVKMSNGKTPPGGDLISVGTFDDFELTFEWKVTHAANSGVKYNVSEDLSLLDSTSRAALGLEYQILDDSLADDNKIASHRAGALFDLVAPAEEKRVRPVGEWNQSRIVFRGNHGEHWLNGMMILEFDLATPEMDLALSRSKYSSIPRLSRHRSGHIALQDHGDEVFYRDIKIREFKR